MTKVSRFIQIEKIDTDQRMVWGYASTPTLDSQGERITLDAMRDALPGYMRFGNVREMHQPSAVGKAISAVVDDKGIHLGAHVVDDAAWKKVKAGVYNGFSVGGEVTKRTGEVIEGLNLIEISLVDRPANPDAVFDVWKLNGGASMKFDLSKWGGPAEASEEEVAKFLDSMVSRNASDQKALIEKNATLQREAVELKQASAQTLALQAENEQLKKDAQERAEKDEAAHMKKVLDAAQAAGKFEAAKRPNWETTFKKVGATICEGLLKDMKPVVPIGQRVGAGGDGEESLGERCDKIVRQIMADEKVTYDVAFSKAYQRNTKLFQQRDNAQLAAARATADQGYGDGEE